MGDNASVGDAVSSTQRLPTRGVVDTLQQRDRCPRLLGVYRAEDIPVTEKIAPRRPKTGMVPSNCFLIIPWCRGCSLLRAC